MSAMNPHPTPQARRALRATLAVLSAALLLAACAAPTAPTSSAADSASLDAAISGPQRSDKNRARDVYRHPKETLQFFGVAPSQTVLEIAPGGGWYTEILAPHLHDHGTLYEAQYDSPEAASAAEEQAGRASFARKLAATPASSAAFRPMATSTRC
jgi:predicted methyltransferase